MNVFVVGCGGLLQQSLVAQFAHRGRPCIALDVAQLDEPLSTLRDRVAGPALLIEVATFEALQRYDFHAWPDLAFQRLLAACAELALPVLMMSHACVFDGEGKRRAREEDAPRPRTDAGRVFQAREEAVTASIANRLLLRSGPVFGASGDNPLTGLLRQLRTGGDVALSADVRLAPTPATDLARVLSGAADQLSCGATCWQVYHYQAADVTTCYEFAETVLAGAAQYWSIGADTVNLLASEQPPCGLPAPLLACQRIRDHMGVQQRPWRLAIPGLLRQIYEGERQ